MAAFVAAIRPVLRVKRDGRACEIELRLGFPWLMLNHG
ncbi:UNVERIFIED_ORG: hypothetical protein GGI57_002707 [Rhizobium aethiopicum]